MKSFNKSQKQRWMTVVFVALLLVLGACNCFKPKTFKIQGRVYGITEQGGEALANATIMLFEPDEVDASVQQLQMDYAGIGASNSWQELFDHRTREPLLKTVADAEGNFTLEGLEKGNYVLVTFLDAWGFRYQTVSIVKEDVTGVQLDLYPVTSLPTVLNEDFSMLEGRVYQAPPGLIQLAGSTLKCKGNAVLLMEEGGEASFHGDLSIEEGASLRIMSKDRIYSSSYSEQAPKRYNQISLHGNHDSEIRKLLLQDCVYGLRVLGVNGLTLVDSRVRPLYTALVVSNSNNVSILNCTVTGSRESSLAALYRENSNHVSISKCHFYLNRNAIFLSNCAESEVRETFFDQNSAMDVHFGENSTGKLEYCSFPNSNLAVYNYKGQIQVHRNEITAKTGIYNYQLRASFSANYNNFDCSVYAVKSKGIFYNSPILHMDATQNYWGTTDTARIDELIYDRNDEDPQDVNYSLLKTVVDYRPFKSQKNTAGIPK